MSFSEIKPADCLDSFRARIARIPDSYIQYLVLFAFGLTALAPLLISVRALHYIVPQFQITAEPFQYMIDALYTSDYDALMHHFIFPCVTLAALLVYVISYYKSREAGTLPLLKQRRDPALVLFAALAVWLLINVFFVNGPTHFALQGELMQHENIFLYLKYYFCFFLMGLFLTDQERKRLLLFFFTAVSLVIVPFAVYLHEKVYYPFNIRSIFSNSGYYGAYLCMIIGLSASMMAGEKSRGLRCFYAAALLVNTTVLYFNKTSASWVGVFFALLFSIIAYRIRDGKYEPRTIAAFILFLAVLIICGLVDSAFIREGQNNFAINMAELYQDTGSILSNPDAADTMSAGHGRWRIWKNCLTLIKEHPLFGIGHDGIRELGLRDFVGHNRPHNEYIQYALFFGIPGLLLYFFACLSVYLRAAKYRHALDAPTLAALTAAFGYLVGAFFGISVYNVTPYLYIMLGLGYLNIRPLYPRDENTAGQEYDEKSMRSPLKAQRN